ncbi:MAG TPA: hypothetical protein VHS53_00980, partial [Mucilaginibacter sp.]|nr:hypothetical protein [Mucilaginibacter sp.]
MKAILLTALLAFLITNAKAQDDDRSKKAPSYALDSVKLITDSNHTAYYQKIVKVDSTIKLSTIYTRVLEFMAA